MLNIFKLTIQDKVMDQTRNSHCGLNLKFKSAQCDRVLQAGEITTACGTLCGYENDFCQIIMKWGHAGQRFGPFSTAYA